jgi:dipeptidyl aminopeptidase/acylaminoacyl peptidase
MVRSFVGLVITLTALSGCGRKESPATWKYSEKEIRDAIQEQWEAHKQKMGVATGPDAGLTLSQARDGFPTKLVSRGNEREAVETPPANVFRVVTYDAKPGKLAAYLTPDLKDGKKRPAMIWITGGDCNSIGDVWSPADPKNDQTASQYRQAGLVMMYPSLRGGNRNPGTKEGFFGEVDDVLAAAAFLAKQPHVDPKAISLGGHSTGGTLALLAAAAAPAGTFHAVFSFGPVGNVADYGPENEYCPFDTKNPRELELRAPIRWIHAIKTPTFVIEGTRGNAGSLYEMREVSENPLVQFLPVEGADHFNVLAPANRLIAKKLAAPATPFVLTELELTEAFGRR